MTKTEEQWDERFGGALENAGGSNLFETFGDDMDTVNAADPKCVWTVLDGEGDSQYLVPGFHHVNRIGYVIAEKPITEAELASSEWDEVLWFDGSELNDDGPTIGMR